MKSKKILSALMALSLVTTSALVGCKNNNENNEPNKTPNVEDSANAGGEEKEPEVKPESQKPEMDDDQFLVFGQTDPVTLDSARSTDTGSSARIAKFAEGLTTVRSDENDNDVIEPGMAETWEVKNGGQEYIFHLRDAKWSDGKPVTAHDFEYAIKRVLNPETASGYAWLLKPVIKNAKEYNEGEADKDSVGVYAVDDKTLKIELTKAIPYFMQLTYFTTLMPQRQDIVEQYGEAYGTEAEQIVANGPFKLTEWVHDGHMKYEKNEQYWDAENVYLQSITYKSIEERSAKMNELTNGTIDLTYVDEQEWKDKFDATGNFNFRAKAEASTDYIIMNQDNKYLKNNKIRKAIFASFDNEELNEVVYKGSQMPSVSYCPPFMMIGDKNYQEVSGMKSVKELDDSITDPKALLIEGLEELGEDPDPSKMELEMIFRGESSRRREIAEWYQQNFKTKLGIQMEVVNLNYGILYDMVEKGEYAIADVGWLGDYNDPSTFFDLFLSDSGQYYTAWTSEEFDKAVRGAYDTTDVQERINLFKRAEEILIKEDTVIIPTNHGKTSTYVYKYLKNYYPPKFGNMNMKYVYTLGRP